MNKKNAFSNKLEKVNHVIADDSSKLVLSCYREALLPYDVVTLYTKMYCGHDVSKGCIISLTCRTCQKSKPVVNEYLSTLQCEKCALKTKNQLTNTGLSWIYHCTQCLTVKVSTIADIIVLDTTREVGNMTDD